jgi:hypothetical protein
MKHVNISFFEPGQLGQHCRHSQSPAGHAEDQRALESLVNTICRSPSAYSRAVCLQRLGLVWGPWRWCPQG